MPLDTFFNLTAQKQNRIIQAATREFAQKGYCGGSIHNIAAEAGVAKGSIYQYFHNKDDLFFYLMDLAVETQITMLAQSVDNYEQLSFFDALEALFNAGIRFAEDNPNLYRIYQDLQKGSSQQVRDMFNDKITELWRQHYENLLSQAVEKGSVRKEISLDLASFVVYTLINRFSEFLEQKDKLSEGKKEVYLKQCLEIIKKGITA